MVTVTLPGGGALHLRDAREDELDEVAELGVAAYQQYAATLPPEFWERYAHDQRTRGSKGSYLNALRRGRLPQVSFIIPSFARGWDEHPPADVSIGMGIQEELVTALRDSSAWDTSAYLITYDEHGGYYDHVPPPPACEPDDVPPALEPTDTPGRFDRYGFRVPLIAVSPWAKPGYVSHKVYDLTSVLRFIQTRFDLPALTRRDANARPLLELFDFRTPRLLSPPALPEASIDPERAEQCLASLKLSIPAVVDKDDNKVNIAYAGWPDRLVVVGVDGKIAYKSGPGPKGFRPEEVEQWLKENVK